MSKTVQNLLEAVVDQKPADFRETFDELMIEIVRTKVDEHRDIVSGKLFRENEEEDEESESVEEEEQIDEVSKKKLGRYVNKAESSHKRHYNKADPDWDGSQTPSYGTDDDQKYHWRKMTNRETGISQAKKKLVKNEEEQIDEVIYDRPLYNKDKKTTVTLPNKNKLKSSWYKNPSPQDMGSKMTSGEVKDMDAKYRAMKGPNAGGQKAVRDASDKVKAQKAADKKPVGKVTGSTERPIHKIARDIQKDWGDKVHYAAKPYLKAMHSMSAASDNYGMDSGHGVVARFLGNASSYRGPNARQHKADLKAHLEGKK